MNAHPPARPLAVLALVLAAPAFATCAPAQTSLGPGARDGGRIPGAEWAHAPEAFLEARWDREGLARVRAKWEEMHEARLSAALLIVDSGYVVAGFGDVEKPYKCHSVRKSFLNALFGVLDTAGALDLEQTLGALGIDDLTPLDADERSVPVHLLLKCRSGIYLPAEAETAAMKRRKPARGSSGPGASYYYNNWDFNALGGIFEKLSGRRIFDAFAEDIAAPIGMQDFDRERDTWYWHDDAGRRASRFPAYHFKMSTRDRARFGLLFLRGGEWGGRRVIDESWIARSARPYSDHDSDPAQLPAGESYGMLWWTGAEGSHFGAEIEGRAYSARGVGGQYIAVLPGEDLVVAHANDTSSEGWRYRSAERNALFRLVMAAKRRTR